MGIFNLTKLGSSPEVFTEISKSLLLAGYSIRFNAVGDSMLPLIRDGDLVIVEAIKTDRLRKGEIVYYQNDQGHCLLHRIIRQRTITGRLELQVQADNNLKPDGWISVEQVMGRLNRFCRNGEWVCLESFGSRTAALLILVQQRLNLNKYDRFRSHRQILRFLPGICRLF